MLDSVVQMLLVYVSRMNLVVGNFKIGEISAEAIFSPVG